MDRVEIEAAVDEWVREVAIDRREGERQQRSPLYADAATAAELADAAGAEIIPPENVTDQGMPPSVGDFEVGGYRTFLIGHMPGADPPSSGVRSHLLDLRFLLTPEETKATIDPMLDRLRAAAREDPELGGRLEHRSRLELGSVAVDDRPTPPNRHGGPVVVLQARIAELDLGPVEA